MAMENKRIIQLSTERTTLGDDDYTIVDSDTNGTAKYRLSRLKETDTTLSVSGMAADAAATGQAINAETQARTQAVAAETQARQQAISAESQARAAADTTLGNDVQDLKSAMGNFLHNTLEETGQFNPSNTWYTSSASDYTVTGGVASFIPTARWGGLKTVNKVNYTSGHKIYAFAKIKGGVNPYITFDSFGSGLPEGDGDYRFASFISEWDGTERRFTILDNASSGWTAIYAKDTGIIDLTLAFGETIPDKEIIDSFVSKTDFFIDYPLDEFLGGFYAQFNGLNFIKNILGDVGRFNPVNSWYTSSASNYAVTNDIASFTPTAQYGGIKTLNQITLTQDHKFYAFATVKGETVGIGFDGYGGQNVSSASQFAFASFVVDGNGQSRRLTVFTYSTTLTEIQVKNCGVIDLTSTFGENVPTKGQMDTLIKNMGFFTAYPLTSLISHQFGLFKYQDDSKLIDLSNKTIVIIGDSVSETNYIIDGELSPHKTNWITYAAPLMNNPTVYNLAQDGTSYHKMPDSDQYRTFEGQYNYMVSKGYEPDIIIVALGTNDIQWPNTDTYDQAMAVTNKSDLDKENLHQAIRWAHWTLAENYPNATIIVGTLIQRASKEVFNAVREATIEMAKTYCLNIFDASTESGIVRQFEVQGGNGRYLSDGLHPNEDGKKLLGRYYAHEIAKLFS